MAAWVHDMFRNFYLVKNHKIANSSTTTDAEEETSADLESLELKKLMYIPLISKTTKFYLMKLTTDFK